MSLFLLPLTCTSFLHVCLWWYSFVMIRRRTSGQLSVIIVQVNTLILLVHLDCRPIYIFSKSTSGFSSQREQEHWTKVLSAEQGTFEFSSKENSKLFLSWIWCWTVDTSTQTKACCLSPPPTEISQSHKSTPQHRTEGTCAHKVPPAKAPAICVRRYKSKEVGVNYVKVVCAFSSRRIKEKTFGIS